MLIPIGQEDSVVRRIPWVSWGILGACVLLHLFVAQAFEGGSWGRELQRRLVATVEYLAQHPWVDAPESVTRFCDPDFLEQVRKVKADVDSGRAYIPSAKREADQEAFDRLVEAFETWKEDSFFRRWGLSSDRRAPWRWIACLFLHTGWLHLIGNMLFFVLTGPFIEDVFGRPLFAGFYLLSGVMASAIHFAQSPPDGIPLVGASGAIAGVMGAFLVRLGRRRIRFLWIPIPLPILWKMRVSFHVPAFVVLPVWFARELFNATQAGEGAGVAFWAHVGGFAFGAFFTFAFRVARVEERWIHPAIEQEISLVRDPSLDRAFAARAKGDLPRAAREIGTFLRKHPQDVDGWELAVAILVENGETPKAGEGAARWLDAAIRNGDDLLVRRILQEEGERLSFELPARFWATGARWLARKGDADGAEGMLASLVRYKPNDPESGRAWLRLADRAARCGDPGGARDALASAAAHPLAAGDPAFRQEVDALARRLGMASPAAG